MAIRPSDLLWSAAAMMVVQLVCLSAWSFPGVRCPKLNHCNCSLHPKGFSIYCSRHGSYSLNFADISNDLVELQNMKVQTLTISSINETVLPPKFFANLAIRHLLINDDRLEFIADEAFMGVLTLKNLTVHATHLKTVPLAVSFIGPKLLSLTMTNNQIEGVDNVLNTLTNLDFLNLERNRIVSLDDNLFSNLLRLRELRLGNNLIDHVPTSLCQAKNLKFIDLHNNRIKILGGALRNLRLLKELRLENNNISNITTLFTRGINLEILRIDGNPMTELRKIPTWSRMRELHAKKCRISTVSRQAFQPFTHLRRVDLSDNEISSLSNSTFPRNSELVAFSAASNSLKNIDIVFSNARWLKYLDLNNNYIEDITKALTQLSALSKLKLNLNRIRFIRDETFIFNKNLEQLDLCQNKIEWLGANCFKGLLRLDFLDLRNNKLLALNGSTSNLPALRVIYLSENTLRVLKEKDFRNNPELRTIYASRNNITSLERSFRNLDNLRTVWLQGNRLTAVHRKSFPEAARALTTVALEGNPIFCDCQVSWLVVSEVHKTKLGGPICNGPAWLQGRPLYNLTTDEVTAWYADCDERCTCKCHEDEDYSRGIHVKCSERRLRNIPKSLPADTTRLYLDGNELEYLNDTFAKKTPKLSFLDLSRNLLSKIEPSMMPKYVQALNIEGNKFSRFPLDLVASLNLSCIQLAENPWKCDCDDYPFSQWASAFDGRIQDAEHVVCAQRANALVSGKPFFRLTQKDLCPSALMQVLAVGLPLFVLVVIALAMSTFYLKFKRQVKVWLYARGVCGFLQCIKEDDLDEDKLFDVFLSFSSRDSAWAYEQLIPKVEANGFSVCTYDRNFKGGFLLHDIIQEAVSCSRRTLLVLTQNFLDSEWCRWEFRVAHHRALEDKINRLIIVLVNEVNLELVDEELQLYMQSTNYLRWGERHFWDKLIYSLPKKDGKHRLIHNALDRQTTLVSGDQSLVQSTEI